MNDAQLTFSGRKAFSWLAAHSYRIGFDEGRAYAQDNGIEIYKTNQTRGRMIAHSRQALQAMQRLHSEWQNQRPDAVVLGDIT